VPGLGRDLLVVTILVVSALVVGGVLLANQRVTWPWEDVYVFRAEFESVPAIAPGKGQEVRIAGVPVGDVLKAEATDHGTAMLILSVKSGDVIYDNSRLVLRPKSPLNEMYITIAPGGPPGHPLPAGGTIPVEQTTHPVPVDEVFSHLDDRARASLTSMLSESDVALANAPADLPPGLRAADTTLVTLRPLMEALQARSARIRALSTSIGQISTAVGGNDVRLGEIANSLQGTLGVIARNDGNLSESLAELPGLATDLRSASQGVSALRTQLDPTLDSLRVASDELPPTLSRVKGTVDQLDTTLDELSPLLARARPVVGDLRPFVGDLRKALDDLKPTTRRLDPVTSGVLPYLPDLKAFMAQSASVTSVRDKNGGFLRARETVVTQSVPVLPRSLERGPKEAPSR
jgi:phospholipid/cholesterol/gamma-HCH transport system substrate-binding protein